MSVNTKTARLSRETQADLQAFLELRQELIACGALVPTAVSDAATVIAAMSNWQLVDFLWDVRGRRSTLFLRTRISQKAEAEDGRRQGRRGRDLT